MQLDERAKVVSAATYADSTLSFCSTYGLVPIPAQPRIIVRFLIYLSTYCKYCTIINYLSAINVLHRHFGHSVTFQDVFTIKLVTRGLRHILGDAREQKLPITPDILRRICSLLSADVDSGYWAAILSASIHFSASQISSPNLRRATTLPNSYLVPTSLSAHGVW